MTGQDKLMRHWIKTLEHRREQFFFIYLTIFRWRSKRILLNTIREEIFTEPEVTKYFWVIFLLLLEQRREFYFISLHPSF